MANVMFFLLVFSSLSVSMCQEMITSNFSKEHAICDVTDRVDRGCSVMMPKSRSRIHCISLCGSDKSCIGASLDSNGLCFHHRECPHISGCTIQNHDHIYMTSHCAHGSWDNPSQSCKCVDGYYGDQCKQCPTDCTALLTLGYPKGEYRVYIDPDHNGQKPFLVVCNVKPPDYAVTHMLRNLGQHNFNKTMVEYVNGFYFDEENFWVGLYPWYRLSITGLHSMVFAFQFRSRDGSPRVFWVHDGTRVSDESTGYRFTFDSSNRRETGDVPPGSDSDECLGHLQNVPFSTWDSDNDNSATQNCAAITGSGWWYTGCDNPCNALGYGLQYLNTKPRNQIMSLLDVDTDSMTSEDFKFSILLR